jgi:hybrid cluster-associated redox disulfide protein
MSQALLWRAGSPSAALRFDAIIRDHTICLRQRKEIPAKPVSIPHMSTDKNSCQIDVETLVDDVMRRRPGTIGVFLRRRLRCVGCPIGPFHTIADAAREHGVDAEGLLTELLASPLSPPP